MTLLQSLRINRAKIYCSRRKVFKWKLVEVRRRCLFADESESAAICVISRVDECTKSFLQLCRIFYRNVAYQSEYLKRVFFETSTFSSFLISKLKRLQYLFVERYYEVELISCQNEVLENCVTRMASATPRLRRVKNKFLKVQLHVFSIKLKITTRLSSLIVCRISAEIKRRTLFALQN